MQRRAYDYENPNATGGWLTPSRRANLADVAAPTLVLVGELDQPSLQGVAKLLGDEIPGAERRELPGVAHVPPMEDPAAFAREVLAFLQRP